VFGVMFCPSDPQPTWLQSAAAEDRPLFAGYERRREEIAVSKTPAPKAPPKKSASGKAKARATAAPAPKKKAVSKPSARTGPPPPAPERPKRAPAPSVAAAPAVGTKIPAMKSAPAPKVTAPTVGSVASVAPKKPARSAVSKYPPPAVQAPLPPPTSRFADRFAPPRPPTRQMSNQELDTPREKHKSDPKLANAWKAKSGRDLTEAELLAMPDSEYMNDKQLEFFRVKLQALKDDLLSNAGETTEHLREDTSIVPDPADRATIEEEHALELRTRDRERKLLKKISQSLARIDAGDYGFCDETGEPIGLGRLIARPTATLSLEAQQRRELKQKMFGD
jgi:DnaK suppressor protein